MKNEADKYMTPTKKYLEEKFKEFNEKYFDGILPPCKLILSKTDSGSSYNPNWNWIVITKDIYWTEETLELVLVHEMVHCYVHTILKKWPVFTHGRTFNRVCDMLRKKHGIKVKMYQIPYLLHKGEKKPTLFKKMLVKCFWYLFRL